MNMTVFIMTVIMLLTLAAPFAVHYAIKLLRKGEVERHKKIQNITFAVCITGLLVFEGLIRYSGGSGSIASQSPYYEKSYFKIILAAHIIGAVLTYLIWIVQIIISNRKFKKSLPGKSSNNHKVVGHILYYGLIYTAITALAVYLMTLNLI